MNIPTYQIFNIDKDSTDACGQNSGYIKRTNYLLDSFRKREITNGKDIKDEGERQYDGTYDIEPKGKSENLFGYMKQKEGFFDFKSISPSLLVISVSSLLVFLYILYNIIKGGKKKIDFQTIL